jgi:hypothetical protein
VGSSYKSGIGHLGAKEERCATFPLRKKITDHKQNKGVKVY